MFEGDDPDRSSDKDCEGRGKDLRTVELTAREVGLLLKYGYPFSRRGAEAAGQ